MIKQGMFRLSFFFVYLSLHGMNHQVNQGLSLTVVDQLKHPDAELVMREKYAVTMRDLIEHGKRPVLISIHNGSNAPITISSESCSGIDMMSVNQVMDYIGYRSYVRSLLFFCSYAALAAAACTVIAAYAGRDLYAVLKATVLARAHERADKREQKILGAGQEIAGWLSFLPIPYMTTIYRLLAKRKQLVPFIKRTMPVYIKKLAARATGTVYVDDTECKTVISELAVRSSGSLLAVVHKYLQLLDVEQMAAVVHKKAPVATVAALGGIAGVCATPFYMSELQFSNYQMCQKLKKRILSSKSITIMPGGQVQQLVVLPNMAVDQFMVRVFDHLGTAEKAKFTVKLG